MDWAKAKSILILVLVALNIFLLSYIISYRLGENISRETIADARQILSDRGIRLDCEIPAYHADTPRLIYENGNPDRQKIAKRLLGNVEGLTDEVPDRVTSGDRRLIFKNGNSFEFQDRNPSEKVDISEKDAVEKYLRRLINELGLQASDYKLEAFNKNPDGSLTFLFTEKFKKFLVFDNRVQFTVSENGILYIHCSYKKIKGFSTGPKTKVMPVYKILLKNFNSAGKMVITHIDIGFKGYASQQDMMEYFESPAWRIVFKDGTEKFFKASEGEEIK